MCLRFWLPHDASHHRPTSWTVELPSDAALPGAVPGVFTAGNYMLTDYHIDWTLRDGVLQV